MNAVSTLHDIVDLDRYPILEDASPASRRLVDRCRAALGELGACDLEGFLRPGAVDAIVAEARTAAPLAFRTEAFHNIEFSGEEASLPTDDPRRIEVRSAKAGIAYDRIAPDSPLRRIYESDELTAFIGAALQVDPIYRQADELGALNVMIYGEGDELGWHFDNADFVVTLMLQPPLDGGVFEYVPMLRTPDDPNPEGVRRLLAGERGGVRTMSGAAGTLALFRGHYSPHRVTPVAGERPRINAVLAYADGPGARMSAHGRRLFYGRDA